MVYGNYDYFSNETSQLLELFSISDVSHNLQIKIPASSLIILFLLVLQHPLAIHLSIFSPEFSNRSASPDPSNQTQHSNAVLRPHVPGTMS